MNEKVLFLDIDGVLNSKFFYKYIYRPEESESRLDPYCVILVKKLVQEFSLKIVISSTWRDGAINRLVNELEKNNLTHFLHEDWLTPVVRPASRGREIQLWLEDHPDVNEYLILDDNQNLLDHQLNKFIQTNAFMGMVQESYYQARILLQTYNQLSVDSALPPEYIEL